MYFYSVNYNFTSSLIIFFFFLILQSVLMHKSVADCAVVGLEDTLKGHVPLALCVLRNGRTSLP